MSIYTAPAFVDDSGAAPVYSPGTADSGTMALHVISGMSAPGFDLGSLSFVVDVPDSEVVPSDWLPVEGG